MASGLFPGPLIDNHQSWWHNITDWTSRHFHHAANLSRLGSSIDDVIWAGPRLAERLGYFVADYIGNADADRGIAQRLNAQEHAQDLLNAEPTLAAFRTVMESSSSPAHPADVGSQQTPATTPQFSMEGAKGLGSVFSYATSKWALSCIAMAIVLNRTYIFAATRRRLRLTWPMRLALRIMPLALFVIQGRQLLQSMQCQTSPDFAQMRWGNSSKSSDLLFIQPDGFLHAISSALLLGASDEQSCLAVRMIPDDNAGPNPELKGSLSLLWPLFGTFCLSQFLETISCAVQGRPVAAETGMTLFEHSLAFAEADSAISNQLGWSSFALKQAQTTEASASVGNAIAISRSMVLQRVNTPPEVLLIALLSVMSHLTSHTLGVFNLQARFRLLSTGFWALCFMASIVRSAWTFTLDDTLTQGLLRFPTVCIIGFFPHVLVLLGIIVCLTIYCLALVISASALPSADRPSNLDLRQRLHLAHANMQANMPLSGVRIGREMDFYTALLRTGFGAITMASEAVYLNEDRDVNLASSTWIEDERFRELEELRRQWLGEEFVSRLDATSTANLIPVTKGRALATSGFDRERAAQKLPKTISGEGRLRDGIGAAERSGRWLMALDFVLNTSKLVVRTTTGLVIRLLSRLSMRIPRWLLWMAQRPKQQGETAATGTGHRSTASHSFQGGITGGVDIPLTDAVDVEAEFRQRAWSATQSCVPLNEVDLDSELYRWWLGGGWWGTADMSGDYDPNADSDYDDDDTTSILSIATYDDNEDAWESEDGDGQQTPTRNSPQLKYETSFAHDSPMQLDDLARLLNPATPEDKEEAVALAAHLGSRGVLTRSQYRSLQHRRRVEILNPNASAETDLARSTRLTPQEETELLERLIISRRRLRREQQAEAHTSWSDGAAGFGSDGPQCVVCQSMSRTIIVWPCRCLSLCDDCRVSLAMNNFDKCVCCRREVISFSRIFVP